jgi:hypothetical protein
MTQEQYYWFVRRPQMLRAANIAYGAVAGCGSTSQKEDVTDDTTNDQSQNTTPTDTPTELTPIEPDESDTPTDEPT